MCRVLILLFLMFAQPAAALVIGQVEGAGWQLRDLSVQLHLDAAGATASIEVAELALPHPLGAMRKLKLDCQALLVTPERIACQDAPLTADWDWLDAAAAQTSFEYRTASGSLRLELAQLSALGGMSRLILDLDADGWRLSGHLAALSAERLAPLLVSLGQEISASEGRIDGRFSLQSQAEGLSLEVELAVAGLTAHDAAGDLASEGLGLRLSGKARSDAAAWRGPVRLAIASGQVYVNPVFVNATAQPIELTAALQYVPTADRIAFDHLHLQHHDTLELRATGGLQLGAAPALDELRVELVEARMARAYPVYLQPFLLGTGLDELQAEGRIRGELHYQPPARQAISLTLESVTAHDAKARYSIDALSGELHWSDAPETVQDSRLQWAGGSAYRLPFEAAGLVFRSSGRHLRLLQPLRLPLLGGALNVHELSADELGQSDMQLAFDGGLEPLSLRELTRALGWPQFAGTLAGRLPELHYRGGELAVGGTLSAQVFDGDVSVNGLRIADPFGRLPRLRADIALRNLDLAAATSAFQFGAIEGRLDGDIQGLRLLNWQPVAFDARLYTPAGDRSRHRISQRAIENISSLGGAGAAGALSRGFMRFFENFAYDRLGIACRLTNGVCTMGGIEDAPDKGGYYLVKGRLVPRIDVIGYATEVSWPALIEQLRSISAGEGPVVK